jgi:rRNA processing protein Gar1
MISAILTSVESLIGMIYDIIFGPVAPPVAPVEPVE